MKQTGEETYLVQKEAEHTHRDRVVQEACTSSADDDLAATLDEPSIAPVAG